MNKAIFLASLLLAAAVVPSVTRSESPESKQARPLTPDAAKAELKKLQEIFASVDTLPPKGARWVEVQAGTEKEKEWHHGWLLRESPSEIQILNEFGEKKKFDNRKHSTEKPDADFQWRDVRDSREGDFAATCRELLAERKKKDTDDDPDEIGVFRFQRKLHEAEAAVLTAARFACWANVLGNKDLAPSSRNGPPKSYRSETLPMGAGRPATTFPDSWQTGLLRKHRKTPTGTWNSETQMPAGDRLLASNQALAKIPYRSDHAEVLQRIRQLDSLVAEDKVWKEPSKDAIAKMDVKQKAAYWLYHLRDLKVMQSSSPGSCRILPDYRWGYVGTDHTDPMETLNAAEELRNLGYEALPRIIEHLDDDRPTKCIGFWHNYAPDTYFKLAYGDCCQQIIEAIALHPIYTTGRYPIREGQGKLCKQRAQEWWSEFRKKGEKQVLIEATRRVDDSSGANAQRLIAKYPEAAFEVVRDAIWPPKTAGRDFTLASYLGGLKDDRVIQFMREEAKGPYLFTRVRAIEFLLQRGQGDGLTLLIDEAAKLDRDREEWDHYLQDSLLRCGSEKATQIVAAPLEKDSAQFAA